MLGIIAFAAAFCLFAVLVGIIKEQNKKDERKVEKGGKAVDEM